MIINSRQHYSNNSSYKPQYSSIPQILEQQQQSVIQWIHQQFSSYPHCRKLHQIQDLYDGIVIAQIISEFLSQQIQEEFLSQIEMTNLNYEKCLKNVGQAVKILKKLVKSVLINVNNNKYKKNNNITDQEQVYMIRILMKSLQNITAELIINDRHKMVQFFIQVIMILPEIKKYIHLQSINHNKQYQFKSTQFNNNRQQNNGLEQLSSIYYQSTANGMNNINNNNNNDNNNNNYNNNYNNDDNNNNDNDNNNNLNHFPYPNLTPPTITIQNQPQLIYHYQQQQRISRLLAWISQSFSIAINQLSQPHLLLGQLINSIFCGSRLSQTQKLIKPIHYQHGTYAVYKKIIEILTEVERFNKNNIFKLNKQLEENKVKESTYWSLIEDLYNLKKNKINYGSNYKSNIININQNCIKNNKNHTQSIKQKKRTEISQFDENINHDNIKNQSITQLLNKNNKSNKQTKQIKLKQCPLYDQNIIKQTQIWLQQQMGMGYSLNKSKQLTITTKIFQNQNSKLFQNPLLSGIIFSKLIQRLKIGCSKGIITTPSQYKHIKVNIQIIKNQLLKRGYECVRKLDIYKGSYNFYVGLISEIRELYENKQINVKNMIKKDKIKKKQEEEIQLIQTKQKEDIKQWVYKQYNVKINNVNNQLHVDLSILKIVIQSILNLNFLRETTQKIRNSNYVKLLQFFRNIGFSQYYHINVEDITNQYHKNKNTQNIRWIILRDLKIVKEQKNIMTVRK